MINRKEFPRILVVEDEAIVAYDLAMILDKYGYPVCGKALSGEEALNFLEMEKPDMVFLDIILGGGIDGIEVGDIVRKKYGIPFVYITASTDHQTLERAKKTAPYAYITKPFSENDIYIAVETTVYKWQVEQSLIEKERWLRALVLGIGEGIISTSFDGRINFMNPVAEELTGWKASECENKRLDEVFVYENGDHGEQISDEAVVSAGKVKVSINGALLKRRDGLKIPADLTITPVVDSLNGFEGTIILFSDITKRLEYEEKIHSASHEWRITFDAIKDSVMVLDSSGKIARINTGTMKIFNNDYHGIVGKYLWDLFDESEYVELMKADFERVSKMTEKASFEYFIKERWYRVSAHQIIKKGGFDGLVVISTDVTYEKKIEKELSDYRNHLEELVSQRTSELNDAVEKANKANRAKGDFLANMSHELRTPLNSIIGFAKLMNIGAVSQEESRRYLSNIVSSGNHLLKLINDVIDISKIEEGRFTLAFERVDIITVIRSSIEMIDYQAREKNIALRLNCGDSLEVDADIKRIKQVMLNLLSNAVKFTHEGGTIDVSILVESCSCLVSVRDNGIGIEGEKLDYIFEKFNQIDSSMSRQNEGAGLGLSITKKIVMSHGGVIWVESVIGEGSTFNFKIPIFQNRED